MAVPALNDQPATLVGQKRPRPDDEIILALVNRIDSLVALQTANEVALLSSQNQANDLELRTKRLKTFVTGTSALAAGAVTLVTLTSLNCPPAVVGAAVVGSAGLTGFVVHKIA